MSSLLVLILLFSLGLIMDALGAFYLRLVNEQRIFVASLVSILITFLGYTAWVAMAESLMSGALHNLLVYSIGGGVGTFLGLYKKSAAK